MEEEEDGRVESRAWDSGKFECNICLEEVREPVVTLCGHLYCWPCIYTWTSTVTPNPTASSLSIYSCPVCNSQLSHAALVPIYVPSLSSSAPFIPRRPSGPVYPFPRAHRPQPPYSYLMPDPISGVLCEMVYRRLFGDSLAGVDTYLRRGRRWRQAEEYLNRVYIFLVCSMIMCLLLF